MDSSIQEIKNRIDIVEYIGQFVSLKKAGRNYKGNCPFHNENTPSFIVSPERQIWRCFGACQEGGDVISFLMKWENITFFEALKDLAKLAGVALENINFEDRQWKIKETMMQIHIFASKYYHYLLTKHQAGRKALAYLKKRNISEKIIETFQLGYAPDTWDSLTLFLKKKGFSEPVLENAGVSLKGQKSYYDRFRGRLMFPIIDNRETIIGFSGRMLENKTNQKALSAKYINSPETPLYKKRETLFGIQLAKDTIKKNNKVIIVEGEFDMISSYMHGITNTVAIKGSAFTREQLQLLKRYTNHIILALDSDFSGIETTKRALKDAEQLDFRVDIAQYDFAKDPDEALQKDAVAYKKCIKNSVPIYDFVIDESIKRHKEKTAYEKKEIADDVVPFLEEISNPIVLNYYTNKLASLIDVNEQTIEKLIRTYRSKRRKQLKSPYKEKKSENRYEMMQKYVLTLLFQNENDDKIFQKISDTIQQDDFSIDSYKSLFEKFFHYRDGREKVDIEEFARFLPKELQSVFDELFLFDISMKTDGNVMRNVTKSLLEMKRIGLKKSLKENVQNDNEKRISELTRQLTQVEKEMSKL